MPARPKSICRHASCGQAIDAPGYCAKHIKESVGWTKTSIASASERGYGSAWRKLRDRVMIRDCGLCQACNRVGRITVATEVDHIVGKAAGGGDGEDNLQALCRSCHAAKTATERATPVHSNTPGGIKSQRS